MARDVYLLQEGPMSNESAGLSGELPLSVSTPAKERYERNLAQAAQLLVAYQQGEPNAVAQFVEHHPQGSTPDFIPTLQDARLLISGRDVRVTNLLLEELTKEAQALFTALKARQPSAMARWINYHPKGQQSDINALQLVDAQHIVAREQGLSSWPQLQTHLARLQQASEHLRHPHLTLDHDLKTLHIRCGSDIREALQQCGFSGDFLEISNPFPQGRVPPFDPLDPFVRIRSDFIVQSYGADIPPEYADRITMAPDEIRAVEQRLRSLPQGYERIVLWFEHDPFDQLCLAYLLAHLVNSHLGNSTLELMQIDRFPGVNKFIGIGYLCQHAENLILLWQQRVAIPPAMMAFGARCWHGFTADNPTALWQLSQEPSPLPLMQQAMRRMLQELPWTSNGLSLTEQL
ncbi:MAG: hypothetical protein FD130_589, partial [Halothiobacillaceae bacterium]